VANERSSDLWWRRVAAALIDSAVIVLLVEMLHAILGYKTLLSGGQVPHGATARILGVISAVLYYPTIMARTDGRTLGKLAMGIHVIRTDRHAMNPVRAGWREVIIKILLFGTLASLPFGGGAISTVARTVGLLVVALDFLWPLWDRENRALHDMLAGTRVRRTCAAGEAPRLVNDES
jgi:uncharacterized RDD family membrane protein YckC